MIDEGYKAFATPRQIEYIDAFNATGSYRAAAKLLGMRHHDNLRQSLKSLKKRAAIQGFSPENDLVHTVPEPFIARGHSTYYNAHGKPTQQWVLSKISDEAYQAALKEAIEVFIRDEVAPIIPAGPPPEIDGRDVIPWIQIGDGHLGMLAHEAETGANFDLKIAERELCSAIALLIDEAPSCERCVINDLGDMTHYENMKAETEASGHRLDADGRFPKMIKTYSRVMRFIVDRALAKFQHVDVIVSQGNHSRTNDIWMAELLRVAYGHTGRVHVLNNDSPFIAYRMGKTLVMVHHSDKCKPNRLAQVMSTDFRQDWGETDYHYVDIGHIHHHMRSAEHPGVIIESWNILAAPDKYAHDAGYRSRQSISMVYRSRTYGEVGRRLLPVQQVRDRILAAHNDNDAVYIPPVRRAYAV